VAYRLSPLCFLPFAANSRIFPYDTAFLKNLRHAASSFPPSPGRGPSLFSSVFRLSQVFFLLGTEFPLPERLLTSPGSGVIVPSDFAFRYPTGVMIPTSSSPADVTMIRTYVSPESPRGIVVHSRNVVVFPLISSRGSFPFLEWA